MNNILFKNKKLNMERMLSFGFTENGNRYVYSAQMAKGQLTLTVYITSDGKISTEITDNETSEEYILHNIPTACGKFVGAVKAEYENVLNDIAEKCFEPDVFKTEQAKEVINYIRDKYQDEFEFLWERFSDNAVVRRKDNGKWYGLLLIVSKKKLGLTEDENIEILDLRINPEDMESIINYKNYFPGYHMNKKHWFTICLDGSVTFNEICKRIDESYNLALKK